MVREENNHSSRGFLFDHSKSSRVVGKRDILRAFKDYLRTKACFVSEYIQVITTVDEKEKAEEIARTLLEQRAVSCVQMFGPITSSYWWKGQIQQTQEWMCLAKGKSEDYERIQAIIKQVHPYEVPEILAIPVSHGSIDYLNWVTAETSHPHS